MYRGELVPDIATSGHRQRDVVPVINQHLRKLVNLSYGYNDEEKQTLEVSIERLFSLLHVTEDSSSSSETPRLRLDMFKVECLIGLGGFGSVWKATINGQDVALKQHDTTSVTAMSKIWKERDALIRLQHARIYQLFGVFYENRVFFVLNLCYGSLANVRNRISPINACRFAVHLLQAVDWIHSNNIIHADIKSDNCLVNTKNQLVLGDFGSVLLLSEGNDHVVPPAPVGTYGYLDLAATRDQKYSKATDLFGAACVIFEMDAKAGLLFCPELLLPKAEFYIDAFENGRLIGYKAAQHLTSSDIASLERESLKQRCSFSNFEKLLIDMIDSETNLSAIDALAHPTLEEIMSNVFGLDFDNIDEDSYPYVTREFNLDFRVPFEPPKQPEDYKPELALSYVSLHYDNLDNLLEPEPTKLVPRKIKKRLRYQSTNTNSSDSE